MLAEELPPGEVKKMAEILTVYHKRGMKEGKKEGITVLQNLMIKLSNRRLDIFLRKQRIEFALPKASRC